MIMPINKWNKYEMTIYNIIRPLPPTFTLSREKGTKTWKITQHEAWLVYAYPNDKTH
jgi:hypothetical protein